MIKVKYKIYYFTNLPFLKKKLYTSLSDKDGKYLFINTVCFPVEVSTRFLFLFSMAFIICRAHSSGVINLLSSNGDWPCGFAASFKAAFLILEAVKPGATHSTFTPECNSSVRSASSHPFNANLLALYPLRPGSPL